MNAFVKTESGLFKVYRVGDDWQILGPKFERWCSVWRADVMGSLRHALSRIPGRHIDTVFLSLEEDA